MHRGIDLQKPPAHFPHTTIATSLSLFELYFPHQNLVLWSKQSDLTVESLYKLPEGLFSVVWKYQEIRLATYSSISEQVMELIDLYEERMAICVADGGVSEREAQIIALNQVNQQIERWNLKPKPYSQGETCTNS